jgi:RHS repeat-associated protein
LVSVKKNGTLISEYGYDPEGLRVVKKAHGETIHYVFEGTEPIYEKNVTSGKSKSYVYALGKHLARVDGEMDTSENLQTEGVPVYFYTTDHLGSIKVVTDRNGTTVFETDHLPFGERYGESTTETGFDEWHSFTGKEFDPDIGLYYFNARWMDPQLGRFISEDPAQDGNNWYVYGVNNPLMYIDPTGLMHQDADGNWVYDDWDFEWNDDYDSYNFWVYNNEFFTDEWYNDPAKLNAAWVFLGVRDFGSNNWVRAGGYDIPYYESRRVQTIQASMGIGVSGWYDGQTRMAAGALQELYGVNNANDSTFGIGTWRAMDSIVTGPDSIAKYNEFLQKYKANCFELGLGEFTLNLVGNAVIFGGGKALLSGILSKAATITVANQTPNLVTTGMTVVRVIKRGEKITDLTNELKSLTFATGNEYAIVQLADGTRAIVSGGSGGISFAAGQVTRIFVHTHPYGLLKTGASVGDINALTSLGQKTSYLLEQGTITKFGVNGAL